MKNLLLPASPMMIYTKRHWFKIAFAAFLVFIFLKKDFRFQLNMKSPIRKESPRQQVPSHATKKKKETLTEHKAQPVANKSTSTTFFDRIPFIGSLNQRSTTSRELTNISEATKEDYMKRFAHVAVKEQTKFGIPASIILASALLHSQADRRELSRNGHNHFALRCTEDWNGRSEIYQGTCYRHYGTNWESFRDHSHFITKGNYSHLTKLGKKDYTSWAKGLEELGFSEEANFGTHLIQIIERYRLSDLD